MAEHVALVKEKKFDESLISNWDETMNALSNNRSLLVVTRRHKKAMRRCLKHMEEHVTLGAVSISPSSLCYWP
jgi:hypothetical protein